MSALKNTLSELEIKDVAGKPVGNVKQAPTSTQDCPLDKYVLVVDVAECRLDIQVDVSVQRHRPPGWSEVPKYRVRDVFGVLYGTTTFGGNGSQWEVMEVLGTRDDRRPGYRVRPVSYDQREDAYLPREEPERIMPPDVERSSAKCIDGWAR